MSIKKRELQYDGGGNIYRNSENKKHREDKEDEDAEER